MIFSVGQIFLIEKVFFSFFFLVILWHMELLGQGRSIILNIKLNAVIDHEVFALKEYLYSKGESLILYI